MQPGRSGSIPRLHEIVEVFDGVPTAGIEADAGHAQFVGDLNALVRVLDLLLPVLGCWLVGASRVDKILVNAEANEADAIAEGKAMAQQRQIELKLD